MLMRVASLTRLSAVLLLSAPSYAATLTTSQSHQESDKLPFLAFLVSAAGGAYVVVCSGTIVHQSYVLTAAGCFLTRDGLISYDSKILTAADLTEIQQLLPHPSYRLHSNFYDVGLVRLRDVITGPHVTVMPLAVGRGEDFVTACWMVSDRGSNLAVQPTRAVPREECGHAPLLGHYSAPHIVCTSVGEHCVVESGAPLFSRGHLHGVASRHHGGRASFTSVESVRGWIVNVVFKDHLDQYFYRR